MLKLHIGCGPRHIPGWAHIDLQPAPHVDHIISAGHLSETFGKDSVDIIYASHILEHFHRDAIPRVLDDWHSVLSPGGVLRLAVPDFQAIAEAYCKGIPLSDFMGLLYGGQDHPLNFHHVAFDTESLSTLLLHAGFVDIKPWDWRKTEHRDIDDFSQAYLPHMDKDNGRLMSLNLQACKVALTPRVLEAASTCPCPCPFSKVGL